MTTIRNQIKIKRDKTKWYILSLALFILIGAGLFANPVQATEQWSQYGKPASVPSTELGGF
jgi:tripartite motif-containing protein 71